MGIFQFGTDSNRMRHPLRESVARIGAASREELLALSKKASAPQRHAAVDDPFTAAVHPKATTSSATSAPGKPSPVKFMPAAGRPMQGLTPQEQGALVTVMTAKQEGRQNEINPEHLKIAYLAMARQGSPQKDNIAKIMQARHIALPAVPAKAPMVAQATQKPAGVPVALDKPRFRDPWDLPGAPPSPGPRPPVSTPIAKTSPKPPAGEANKPSLEDANFLNNVMNDLLLEGKIASREDLTRAMFIAKASGAPAADHFTQLRHAVTFRVGRTLNDRLTALAHIKGDLGQEAALYKNVKYGRGPFNEATLTRARKTAELLQDPDGVRRVNVLIAQASASKAPPATATGPKPSAGEAKKPSLEDASFLNDVMNDLLLNGKIASSADLTRAMGIAKASGAPAAGHLVQLRHAAVFRVGRTLNERLAALAHIKGDLGQEAALYKNVKYGRGPFDEAALARARKTAELLRDPEGVRRVNALVAQAQRREKQAPVAIRVTMGPAKLEEVRPKKPGVDDVLEPTFKTRPTVAKAGKPGMDDVLVPTFKTAPKPPIVAKVPAPKPELRKEPAPKPAEPPSPGTVANAPIQPANKDLDAAEKGTGIPKPEIAANVRKARKGDKKARKLMRHGAELQARAMSADPAIAGQARAEVEGLRNTMASDPSARDTLLGYASAGAEMSAIARVSLPPAVLPQTPPGGGPAIAPPPGVVAEVPTTPSPAIIASTAGAMNLPQPGPVAQMTLDSKAGKPEARAAVEEGARLGQAAVTPGPGQADAQAEIEEARRGAQAGNPAMTVKATGIAAAGAITAATVAAAKAPPEAPKAQIAPGGAGSGAAIAIVSLGLAGLGIAVLGKKKAA